MSYLSKKGSSHIVHDLKDQNGSPFWEMLEDGKAYKREEGLLQILDNLPSALFTVDKKGRINYFNAAAGQITGFSASDAIGMHCRDVFRNPSCEECCSLKERTGLGAVVEKREFIATRIDGQTVPLICRARVLRDRQGNVIGGVGVFKDISDRKHLEESLRDSERKLSTLIGNLPGIAYRCLNDENRTMEFFSEGCFELTGYRPSDLIGNRTHSYNELIHPDDRRRVWDQVQEALAERRSFRLTYRIRTAAGEEKLVWEQGIGVFTDEGDLHVLEGFITDISEPKLLEEGIFHLSESKYRHIFEGSKDMIFIVSKDNTIKDVNQAGVELLKYSSKQELLSLQSVQKIYSNPIHWEVFCKQINRYGFLKDFEAVFKRKDGALIHCLLSGNAVRDWRGEIVGYEGIAKDITARMDDHKNLLQRHRELQVLTSVALAMNTTQDLDNILMTALEKVLKALNLSRGGILLIDHEEPAFLLRVQKGFPVSKTDGTHQVQLHDELLMRSLLKRDLSLKPEPIFPPFRAKLKGLKDADSIELICFLITAKEKASGFLALGVPTNKDLTTGQDFHLLGSLGNFLGGAIENARLVQTIHKHREELKGLTARLFHSHEEERKRIAQELHDEVGQAITGINFTLETIEKGLSPELTQVRESIFDIKRKINRTYQEMRRISHRLHPALLSDLGLEPALDSYLTDVSKHSDLEFDFKMVGFEERVDPEIETALYRVSQEALTNTLKHSNAKRFRLSIIRSYPHIIFLAEDDGVGFDSSEFNEHRQALGLLGMRERASMLGGSFSIHTSKGKGTRIRIEIPVKRTGNEG